MKKTIMLACGVLAITFAQPDLSFAQNVFRSTQSANLPTAAMLNRGNWLFEISHRFDAPISGGAETLWGVDGPVWNRLGLTYAPADRLMLGVLRTIDRRGATFSNTLEETIAGDGSAREIFRRHESRRK